MSPKAPRTIAALRAGVSSASAPAAPVTDPEPVSARPDRIPRPPKDVRFTLDLAEDRHAFLKRFAEETGAGVRASQVMRALLDELADDPELAGRVRGRIRAARRLPRQGLPVRQWRGFRHGERGHDRWVPVQLFDHRPQRCPFGHHLGPGQATVSWRPCACGPAAEANERGRGMGHLTVTCGTCWDEHRVTRYHEPPHDTRAPAAGKTVPPRLQDDRRRDGEGQD